MPQITGSSRHDATNQRSDVAPSGDFSGSGVGCTEVEDPSASAASVGPLAWAEMRTQTLHSVGNASCAGQPHAVALRPINVMTGTRIAGNSMVER